MTLATASLADFTGFDVAGGRFYTAAEDAHGAHVVVLGHRLAQELAGSRDALWLVGRSVRIGGERRDVAGVLAAPSSGDEPDLVAFAPLRGGTALLGPASAPRVATLRLRREASRPWTRCARKR